MDSWSERLSTYPMRSYSSRRSFKQDHDAKCIKALCCSIETLSVPECDVLGVHHIFLRDAGQSCYPYGSPFCFGSEITLVVKASPATSVRELSDYKIDRAHPYQSHLKAVNIIIEQSGREIDCPLTCPSPHQRYHRTGSAYVLVNRCCEGNAPLTVQGLTEMLRG